MKNFVFVLGLVAGITPNLASAETKSTAAATVKTATPEHDAAPVVTTEEMKKLVDAKAAFIVDCNGKDVFQAGHIPGAINFANHEGKLADVLPKDKNALIVAYCGGTMCSAWEAAATEAKAKGYTNIKHFKGGINAWKEAKYPVQTGAGKSS